MSRLLSKASSPIGDIPMGKFEKYNLNENPFPSQAILNKDSNEKKSNGSIYEPEIRTIEYNKIKTNFIEVPQSNLNHQRLGFILDSSYIGRGNGKTAFLLNIIKEINNDYCLALSKGVNKCVGLYLQPESAGKTKTFESFIDIFFQAIIDTNIIENCLAIVRLLAIIKLAGSEEILQVLGSEEEIIRKLNDDKWIRHESKNYISFSRKEITAEIFKDKYLQNINRDFPLYGDLKTLSLLTTQQDLVSYYNSMKKGKERFDFIFSDLISLFLAAGFNGMYVFVDDFERIPDYQSAIQKKDFVTQLRTILYDGLYLNSKIGFYNFIFALHAGVPRILLEAWNVSGLEHRVSLNPTFDNPKHMIQFDKIDENHAVLLVEKYLSEYRIHPPKEDEKLFPFTMEAIKVIGLKSELNAAKILQMAYNIVETAAENDITSIDKTYVESLIKLDNSNNDIVPSIDSISKTDTIDLIAKAAKKE